MEPQHWVLHSSLPPLLLPLPHLILHPPTHPPDQPAANGKSATASITVPIARRPACTAASCLVVSPTSGPTDTTTFAAAASGFVADAPLVYDFGVRSADGRSQYHARGAASPSFSFAPRVLEAGQHTLFVCARDPTGAQACSTAVVTVGAAAAAPTAADVSALASSLDTAVAAGSSDALLSAVRQLSAVAAAGGAATQAAATTAAESAVGALNALAGSEGASVEDSLGAAAAGVRWWGSFGASAPTRCFTARCTTDLYPPPPLPRSPRSLLPGFVGADHLHLPGRWCLVGARWGDAKGMGSCTCKARAFCPPPLPSCPTHPRPHSPTTPQVATSAVQTLTAAGGAVQPGDLDPLLDIAGAAGPALAQTGAATRRRLLQAATSPAQLAAALDALTRSFAARSLPCWLAWWVAAGAARVGSSAWCSHDQLAAPHSPFVWLPHLPLSIPTPTSPGGWRGCLRRFRRPGGRRSRG